MIYGKTRLWHSHVDYTISEEIFMQAQDGRNDRKRVPWLNSQYTVSSLSMVEVTVLVPI